MNCSHAWEKECTEFTSNREPVIDRTDAEGQRGIRNYSQLFHLYPQTTFVMHRKVTAILRNPLFKP